MVVEIDEQTKQQVRQLFEKLENEVTIHLFTRDEECLFCNETRELVTKVAELSDRIKVVPHEGPLKKSTSAIFGVQHQPAFMLYGKGPYKIRFNGIPAGHEFTSLIAGILDVSASAVSLPKDIIDDIQAIDKPVHIKVFTTPECPYCPSMVRLAWQAAIINPLIEAEGFESLEFQELVKYYKVQGVPKTVVNETVAIEGLVPPGEFVEKLYEAIGK
ncbi:MAG: glutaredoxin [Candidatus Thorarchaeota archaeon]|nr:MAG: glutaredoxin [Candidatus Thorarchaeota archaeon]